MLNKVCKSYDTNLLVDKLSLYTKRRNIGIVEKWCRKINSLKNDSGLENPDSGEIILGETVKIGLCCKARGIGWIQKCMEAIPTVSTFSRLVHYEVSSRSTKTHLPFDQQKPVDKLSKGRKGLHLANTLKQGLTFCCR